MGKRRFEFHNQCDRFRSCEQGEADWNEMMRNATPVSRSVFESVCDPESMLDEGETLLDFMGQSGDPDAMCYQSSIRDHVVLFVQVSGFEFIFTPGGAPLPEGPARSHATGLGL